MDKVEEKLQEGCLDGIDQGDNYLSQRKFEVGFLEGIYRLDNG